MGLGYRMENDDGSIDVPLFFGDDPGEWISWVESYGSDQGFSDFHMRQFAHGFIEGDALAWYYEVISHSPFNYWEELRAGLLRRFGKNNNLEHTKLLSEIRKGILELKQISGDSDSKQMGTETNQTEANPLVQIVESDSCLDLNGKTNSVEVLSKRKDETSKMYPLQILEGKLSHEEQFAEPKRKDVDMAKHACQVFDKMTKRRKKNKRHKEISHGWDRINYKHEVERNKVRKRRNSCIQLRLLLKLYGMQSKLLCMTNKKLCENVYQLFVKMSRRRNKATMKRKKKKWKKRSRLAKSKSGIKLIGNMEIFEGFTKRKYGNMTICFKQGIEEQLSYERQTAEPKQTYVVMVIHVCQRFDQMSIREKESTKKKKKKRWKNLSKENYISYGRSKGCITNERVLLKNMTSCWICHELELSAGKVNKKPCVKMKILVSVKILPRRKRVKGKKRFDNLCDSCRLKDKMVHIEKPLRKKMKNKLRRHKAWTVRESQRLTSRCHKKNISTYQVADKIWPLMLPKEKIKVKENGSDVLLLTEWDKLIARVKTVKEKMFWTSAERHKISHKHAKEKVILFLIFERKRAFIDPILRVKKRTRLKLKREFTNSNCVLPVIYVKLLWRFIKVKKNQFRKRPKFRKKHSERKRKNIYVEYKRQAWETVFVVELSVCRYGIQVEWGKLTGNSIISLCLVKDLGDRFVSEITKLKDMIYLKNKSVKELIQVAYFEREWSFSLGKSIVIASETVSTNPNGGKTLEKVSLVSINRERGIRLTWVDFFNVYGSTVTRICGKKIGLAGNDDTSDRQLGKQPREDQWRHKVKGKEEKGFVRSLTAQNPCSQSAQGHATQKSDTKSFSDPHLEDKVNFERRGIDTSSDLEG